MGGLGMIYNQSMETRVEAGFAKILVVDMLLLVPATAFWVAAVMYVTMGADYLFQSVVARVGITPLGNALLIFLVVACPGIVIATNGMQYVLSKSRMAKTVAGFAAILMILGFFAVLRKGG